MYAYAAWNVDASQILSRRELAQVLTALKNRAARLPNVQMNLVMRALGINWREHDVSFAMRYVSGWLPSFGA